MELLGKKSVHHEIEIKASPAQVWEVLTNMQAYGEWNPVMQLLEGDLKVGNKLKYQFTQDAENVSKIGATVKQIVPNKLLNQAGGMPMVLTFNHKYILDDLGGSTKVTIHEDYTGVGVHFWNPKPVGDAYGRLNEALKKRVEYLHNS